MSDVDTINSPWWIGPVTNDYTRSRSGPATYTIQDLIGRKDYVKYSLTTDSPLTVSGTSGTILV